MFEGFPTTLSQRRKNTAFLQRKVVRYWVTPFVVATILFSIVQPAFAQVVQGPQTLVQYVTGGNSVVVDSGIDPDSGESFRQIYYDYQGQRTYVTDGDYTSADPDTDGQYIVWMSQIGTGWQIFLYDLLTEQTLRLTQEGVNVRPKISGGNVVWEGQTQDDWQIFLYDGTSTRQVTQGDLSVNVGVEGDEIIFNRKDAQGVWRAINYAVSTDIATVIGNGRLSKFPEFRPGGTVVFRAEEEDKAYQAFLVAQRLRSEEAARLAEEQQQIDETGLDIDDSSSDSGLTSREEALVVFGIRGCPVISRAICGADGVSYLNSCIALRAGTTPSSVSACDGQPIQGDALWSDNYDGDLVNEVMSITIPTPKEEKTEEEQEQDEVFEPEFREDALNYFGIVDCPEIEKPVCGDDDVSYLNACIALRAGAVPTIEGICEDRSISENVLWSDNYEGELLRSVSAEDVEGSDEEIDESASGILGFVSGLFQREETGEAERARILQYIRDLFGLDDEPASEEEPTELEEELEEPKEVTEEEIEEELEGEILVEDEIIEGEDLIEDESAEAQDVNDEDESDGLQFIEDELGDGLEILEDEIGDTEAELIDAEISEEDENPQDEEPVGEEEITADEPIIVPEDEG